MRELKSKQGNRQKEMRVTSVGNCAACDEISFYNGEQKTKSRRFLKMNQPLSFRDMHSMEDVLMCGQVSLKSSSSAFNFFIDFTHFFI